MQNYYSEKKFRIASDIVRITGPSKAKVKRAMIQIDLSLQGKRFQRPPTHFLSFRLSNPSVCENFREFKNRIIEEFGIDERLFVNEGKLHLTVGVLHLLSTKEVEKATTVLTTRIYDIVHSVLAESKTTKLELEMEGLEIMNDDPYMTDVVYAKVSDHDEILQKISDSIFNEFVKEELAEKKHNRVKIHCTLLNSKFLSDNGQDDRDRNKTKDRTRYCFDASVFLKKYEKNKFGKVVIDMVYLNELGKPSSSDGYYNTVNSVEL